MASFRIQFDAKEMQDLLASENGPTGEYLAKKALQVEARAKRLCPVDTGNLRASITSAIDVDGDTITAVVGTNVAYAPYVEFGTVRMNAQPFLLPALASILSGGNALDIAGQSYTVTGTGKTNG